MAQTKTVLSGGAMRSRGYEGKRRWIPGKKDNDTGSSITNVGMTEGERMYYEILRLRLRMTTLVFCSG